MSFNVDMQIVGVDKYQLTFPFKVNDIYNKFGLFTIDGENVSFVYNPKTDRDNFAKVRSKLESDLVNAILNNDSNATSLLNTATMVHCLNYWTFNNPAAGKLERKNTPLLLMLADMAENSGDTDVFKTFVALREQASKVTREVPLGSTKKIEAQKYLDMIADLFSDVLRNDVNANKFALLVCKDFKWILGSILNPTPEKKGKDGKIEPAKPALLTPTNCVFADFDYSKFYDPKNPVYVKMGEVKDELANKLNCTKIYATNPTTL